MAKKGYTHKITPIKPNKLIKIFESFGLKKVPSKGGSHIPMMRKGMLRPAVVVKHSAQEVKPNAVKGLLKIAGISAKDYLERFNAL